MWPDRRLIDLFGIETPILQAPMAGAQGLEMTIAVSEAGGLGALPCAMLSLDQARTELGVVRQRTAKPFNVNFFAYHAPPSDPVRDDSTVLTNAFTGRPARGIVNRVMRDLGAINPATPSFPLAAGALLPLKVKAEAAGSGDFTNLWSGQAASLARETTAAELTRRLAAEALEKLAS